MGQEAVEQEDVGRELRDFGGLGVVEALRGGNEKPEHQSYGSGHQSHTEADDIFGIRAKVTIG
jgi:hypothetical protein